MREDRVTFFSEGEEIGAILRLPDDGDGPYRGIVQGPGWMGLKDAKLYLPYHEALTAAGFAVLIFDYRGFGDSGGRTDLLIPAMQLEDLINAVTYLGSRDDIDADNIGTFGSGGTGGGNAIVLAASDPRVGCAVSQVPVADGADWLHRMRSEHEWLSFLERLAADRVARVTTGKGESVHPREEIMVPTPERKATNVKGDVDSRTPTSVQLRSAEAILEYKPIELVSSISPRGLMIIGVDNDAVTPTDHAIALFEAAGEPKKLIIQRHTTHYAAYKQYGDEVIPQIVEWFDTHLRRGHLDVSQRR
ncbi:MAG: alpha/beta fold hydrolase [Acidimicrobiia bacterium]|nr:alpha/beta fold hydrolase [Acidimicrobiia bacterium]